VKCKVNKTNTFIKEQEYDAQANMEDDTSDNSIHDNGYNLSSFLPQNPQQAQQQQQQNQSRAQPQQPRPQQQQQQQQQQLQNQVQQTQPPIQQPGISASVAGPGSYMASLSQAYEHYDPMMDTDPFGLSSSMQIPATFSYEPGRG
jgi:hypothetical protein